MKSFGFLPIRHLEIGQCLVVPAQPVQRLHAMVAGKITRRVGGEDPVEIFCGLPVLAEGQRGSAPLDTSVVILGRSHEQPAGEFQGASRVADILVSLTQEPLDIGVVGMLSVQMFEIGDRFGQPSFGVGQPAAVDERLGIVGVGGEPAVHLGAFGLAPRVGFEDFADDSHRRWRLRG